MERSRRKVEGKKGERKGGGQEGWREGTEGERKGGSGQRERERESRLWGNRKNISFKSFQKGV